MNVRLLPLLLILANPLQAALNLETTYRRNGKSVVQVFEPQRAVLQTSSAVILDKRDEIGYGVVISEDGLILAKASEIQDAKLLQLRVDQELFREVAILGVNEEWDVVLLKVAATNLKPVEYASSDDLPQGTWVVANGATSLRARRALVGIISAKTRKIPEGGGNLGISLKEEADSLMVEELDEEGGGSIAGMKKGDVIVEIEGVEIHSFQDIADVMEGRRAGTTVNIVVSRKGEHLSLDAVLKPGPLTRNDAMSGSFSERRSGFPRVLQHDIIANKSMIGGPLLDLQGKCVGMNIARANRAESFAIPAKDLKQLAKEMVEKFVGK